MALLRARLAGIQCFGIMFLSRSASLCLTLSARTNHHQSRVLYDLLKPSRICGLFGESSARVGSSGSLSKLLLSQ